MLLAKITFSSFLIRPTSSEQRQRQHGHTPHRLSVWQHLQLQLHSESYGPLSHLLQPWKSQIIYS